MLKEYNMIARERYNAELRIQVNFSMKKSYVLENILSNDK
jgi:hypothetical protein